jgi:amino acid transporter
LKRRSASTSCVLKNHSSAEQSAIDENPRLTASSQDERVLAGFGYRQELLRDVGLFSSFAMSFSLISVTSGIFALYGVGLNAAGPVFIWTWLVVGAGQILVALVFANLAKQTPLSGYSYQWVRRLATPTLAWWAGWLAIVQMATGMPAACYGLATYFVSYAGIAASGRNITAATIAILLSLAVINHFGIHLASRLNDFAVGAEILGSVVAGITLLVLALLGKGHPLHFVLTAETPGTGTRWVGALGFSSLMSIWTLTGFENAANLAEETKFPQRIVPTAIVSSLVISVVLGFLVLVGFTLAIPSLSEARAQSAPLLYTMQARLPSSFVAAVMPCVFLAIYASALANLISLTRMVWAMARDRQLPQSAWLGRINARRIPANALWLITAISIAFACWAKVENVMTSISSLAAYTTYALIIGAAAWSQAGTTQTESAISVRVPKTLVAAAFLWLLLVIMMLCLPQAGVTWKGVIAMAGAAGFGALLRTGTLRVSG